MSFNVSKAMFVSFLFGWIYVDQNEDVAKRGPAHRK
jgi:hypothetical protein